MRVGYGRAMITPPLGTPCLLGLDTGIVEIFDDLFVRAIWLEVDKKGVLILAADIIGLTPGDHDEFVARVAAETGLPEDSIILHSIHPHQTGNSRWESAEALRPFGLADRFASPDFKTLVASGYVSAAKGALADSSECLMAYSRAPVVSIASNRRIPDCDRPGKVIFRQSRPPEDLRQWPEGPIDPLVRMVLFKEVNGPRMTGICNYNCHPTSTGGDGAPYATGDFPHAGMEIAEREVPGLRLLHLTGTAGEINPGKHITGNMDAIADRKRDRDAFGQRYAEGILQAMREVHEWKEPAELVLRHNRGIELELQDDVLSLAEAKENLRAEVAEYLEGRKHGTANPNALRKTVYRVSLSQYMRDGKISVRAAAMRLGDVLFSFMPGEIFLQFGNTIRERLGHPMLLNVELCFGSVIGYVVPPECFAQGGYEPTATQLAHTAYDVLLDEMVELLSPVTE